MFNKENFSNFVKKSEKFKETKEMSLLEDKSKKEIFNFQQEKEKIVSFMHELLKKADHGEKISFGDKDFISVGFDGENYKTFGKKGGFITKGDIAVASLWGGSCLKLNAEIDKKTKKEFILRESRRKIHELWDKQLGLAVKDSQETNHINSIRGLESSSYFDDMGAYEKMTPGHLAEKMVNSFFTKIIVNNPDLPFTMEQGDVFDDALEKMDFIFHIKKEYSRGLNIESCHQDCEKEEIGVQYTMNNKKDVQEKKLKQIASAKKRNKNKIDDIVLVTVPLNKLHDAVKNWRSNNKKNNFSGPERFLSQNDKKELFVSMLDNLPEYLGINPEEYWKKIKEQI